MDSATAEDRVARFTVLFNDFVPIVRGFVRTQVMPSDVEPVVQATFETAWTKLDAIPLLSHRAWLFGVARNHVRNLVRSERRRDALVSAMVALRPATELELFAGGMDVDVLEDLTAALSQLSDLDREIVQLTLWHGFGSGEVAEVLDMTAENVRVRLHRARRQLIDLLKRREVES